MVDDNSEPLVVTKQAFDAFEPTRTSEKDSGWYGRGIYMSGSASRASNYAKVSQSQARGACKNNDGANVMGFSSISAILITGPVIGRRPRTPQRPQILPESFRNGT